MAYGIKISKSEKDAKTCDDKDLIIDSRKEHLKIKYAGELNLTLSNSTIYDTISFNHNLGYYPVHYVFFKLPSEAMVTTRRICEEDERSVFEATTSCGAFVTTSQLVCWVNRGSYGPSYLAGKVVNFKYYIFANSIEPSPLPRVSSEGPWLDVVYADMTLGVNFSKPSPTPGIIKDANYGDLSFGG